LFAPNSLLVALHVTKKSSAMALPSSTANWHWKTKHVTPWARQWFEQELTVLTVKGEGDEVVRIESVTDVEGDVELGQRKSK
jgi:activator of Hsp90 ATPase protein 1